MSRIPQEPRAGLLWHHVWTAIFAANLVMPMWFASELLNKGLLNKGGEGGMALAVAILWLVGDLAGVSSRGRRFVLISGGIVVAVSQVLPLLQIFAGAVSLALIAEVLGGSPERLSDLECFLATSLTGSFLLVTSCLAGLLIRRLVDDWRRINRLRRPRHP